MLGGSLSRYHTPTVQTGGAFVEDLIKVAGPMVVDSMGRMVQDVQRGATVTQAMRQRRQALKKTLKRKAPAMAASLGGRATKRKATSAYKRLTQPLSRVKDILS